MSRSSSQWLLVSTNVWIYKLVQLMFDDDQQHRRHAPYISPAVESREDNVGTLTSQACLWTDRPSPRCADNPAPAIPRWPNSVGPSRAGGSNKGTDSVATYDFATET